MTPEIFAMFVSEDFEDVDLDALASTTNLTSD
jgi:hypothetical protein